MNSGQHFGSYEILKLLGSGGMGEVYLARDTRLDRPVAIKILAANLTDNPDLLARFRKEAGLAARLNHPNICTIHEAGQVGEQSYICMEYIEGKTLRERIAGEPIPLAEVLDISIQIADALEEARKKNIVHRDIKSANIVLTSRNFAKVLDFGLAKQIRESSLGDLSAASTESSLTTHGNVPGTVAYMSPEQALGRTVDHRSDIFSFGVVLYEMLTGRLPFTGSSTTEVVDAILHTDPAPVARYNNNVPPDLVRVLNKMLEKDSDSRYQSVHEVWIDLRHIKGDSSGQGVSRGLLPPTSFFRRNAKVLVIVSLLAVLAGGVVYFSGQERKPATTTTPTAPQKVSIAVLPFRYEGEDPTRHYLGAMVTDGLIASLQPVPGIIIAPYATVREIKHDASLGQIVRDLGVRWVIRGTVGIEGDNTLITPEVITAQGVTVWKQRLSGRTVTTLDLAKKSILNALQLQNAGSREIEQVRTPSTDAYRIYMEARNLDEGWDVQGNHDEAIKLYRQALQQDPDFAAARAGLSRALIDQFHRTHAADLLSQADDEANKAIGLDPNLPEGLLAYGLVQLERGRSIEARSAFLRALELAPGDDSACRNLAMMYSELGRKQEAEDFYKRAISLRSNYWKNYYDFGTFEWLEAGDIQAARKYLEKADQLHPEGYTPLVQLGNLYLTQGKLEEAETYYRKSLERSPNIYAYNNLGMVHYYRGQYDLALRNWQALLKEVPDKPLYEANVADALRQLKRAEEANGHYHEVIRRFRLALKTTPSDDTTRAGLAMALAAIGQCKEASSEARGFLSRHPDSPTLAAYGAITASRCGDLQWAKQIVLNSIAADNLLMIRFDPDLQPVREMAEVMQALKRTPMAP